MSLVLQKKVKPDTVKYDFCLCWLLCYICWSTTSHIILLESLTWKTSLSSFPSYFRSHLQKIIKLSTYSPICFAWLALKLDLLKSSNNHELSTLCIQLKSSNNHELSTLCIHWEVYTIPPFGTFHIFWFHKIRKLQRTSLIMILETYVLSPVFHISFCCVTMKENLIINITYFRCYTLFYHEIWKKCRIIYVLYV